MILSYNSQRKQIAQHFFPQAVDSARTRVLWLIQEVTAGRPEFPHAPVRTRANESKKKTKIHTLHWCHGSRARKASRAQFLPPEDDSQSGQEIAGKTWDLHGARVSWALLVVKQAEQTCRYVCVIRAL